MDPTSTPKIQKPELKVRKPRGSDIKWSNPYGDQATHFVGCIESLNADNSYCDHKKIKTTSNVGPSLIRVFCVLCFHERSNVET
jgi:hypothetical protein